MDGAIEMETQKQNFILVEETLYSLVELEEDKMFPRHRVLRLILDKETSVELHRTLAYFDQMILQSVNTQNVARWVRCSRCKQNGKSGYFPAKERFEHNDEMEMCQPNGEHPDTDTGAKDQDEKMMDDSYEEFRQTGANLKFDDTLDEPLGQTNWVTYSCPPHEETSILSGAMKINCQKNPVRVQTRICKQQDFDRIVAKMEKSGLVRELR